MRDDRLHDDEPTSEPETAPAPPLEPVPSQRETLMAEGVTLCPWCDGTGERLRAQSDRVPCAPCGTSGGADRWQGPAADDWRVRVAASKDRRARRNSATTAVNDDDPV
jgi:hypothetical protein